VGENFEGVWGSGTRTVYSVVSVHTSESMASSGVVNQYCGFGGLFSRDIGFCQARGEHSHIGLQEGVEKLLQAAWEEAALVWHDGQEEV